MIRLDSSGMVSAGCPCMECNSYMPHISIVFAAYTKAEPYHPFSRMMT